MPASSIPLFLKDGAVYEGEFAGAGEFNGKGILLTNTAKENFSIIKRQEYSTWSLLLLGNINKYFGQYHYIFE